jgi:hypothetical protein
MAMNYHPSTWERIGGPWAITLRAYLWTAPLAVILQPIIEPGAWSGQENLFVWFAVCALGYLAFGAFLFVANKFIIPNRDVKPAPVIAILLIAVVGGSLRSTVIGTAIPVFGLTGIGAVERMPFGAIITVFWIISASLIMDAKYRYRQQLDELVAEQIPLLEKQKAYLAKFTNEIPTGSKSDFDKANFQLQNIFRELIVRAGSAGAGWEPVSRQAYRSVMNLIFVQTRPRRFSEFAESDFMTSRKDTFQIITRTPLFHIPVVFSFYFTSIFLTAARILPIKEAAVQLTVGLLINLLILVAGKKIIERGSGDSSFGYLAMCAVLVLQAIIGPLFSSAPYITIFELQVFAVAGTSIEIIWLAVTGILLLSQQNRQKIIDQATAENELLRVEIQYWETIASRAASQTYSPTVTLGLIASDLQNFLATDQPEECKGAIECASTIIAEIQFVRRTIDDFSIESEFERIVATWGQDMEILWTVSGETDDENLIRRAITLIEILILRARRDGGASVISIHVANSGPLTEVIVSDNGVDHSVLEPSLSIEILQEISNNSWNQVRSGGVNKVSAQVSI